MPVIDTPAGTLEVTNAILSASEFRATQKISVSNSAPTKNFSVGDKFHVSTTDADAVNITGNLVAQTLKIGNLLVSPTFDLAAVSNVGNTTSNTLQFANATTSFVASSNVEIGGNITLTSNAQVKVGSNVLAEYTGPHGREPKEIPLKKFPEIAFEEGKFDSNESTNVYVQAGYTVTASSRNTDIKTTWRLYDGTFPNSNPDNGWHSQNGNYDTSSGDATSAEVLTGITGGTSSRNGAYTTIELPHKIKLSHIQIHTRNTVVTVSPGHPKQMYVYGSNDGSSWTQIVSHLFTSNPSSPIWQKIDINSTTPYNYFALQATSVLNMNDRFALLDLEWYGYEEPAPPGDLSLDTTLKSTFNSVRSNNYVMYFDGEDPATGNVPKYLPSGSVKSITPNNVVFDATNNCWTLDGSTESNVTTGSLGFEGDVPHTVSTWINASNLEANASTQQLFSIGSGYDKSFLRVDDTQIAANTWHNVTYAYQGEGGSKVTYVDGRKVEEAQSENTFSQYPPFAMTTYSQGGYVVNSSSQSGDSRNFFNYKAFNGIYGSGTGQPGIGWNSWSDWVSPNGYNGGSGAYSGNKRLASETVQGEWLSIKFPHKLIVSQFAVHPQNNTNNIAPTSGYIYGKNGSSSWEVISNWTDLQSSTLNTPMNIFPNTYGKAYEEFALVGTKRYAGDGASISIGEWKIYGHKEGDLTRFPEPTRVLKYPHIVTKNGTGEAVISGTNFTSYAQRGHIIKASSWIASYPPYAVFNGQTNVATGTVWVGGYNQYGTSHGNGTGGYGGSRNLKTDLGTGGSATSNGEWLYIEMPHKIKVTSTKIVSYDTSPSTGHPPENLIIYGTNDPSSSGGWNVVDNTYASSSSGVPNNTTGKTWTVSTASSPTAYKYFAYVLVKVNNSGTLCHALLSDWQLLGTEEDTGTPAIVGGPFAGKVANFRVYDQYLGDERIQEIYDAQKDEFGHKKSSMTLYKGRVGVGTTEPEGALTVIDEPHALERFPARAISGNYSYVEGQGCIKVSSADGYYSGEYYALDGKESTCWESAPGINTQVSEDVDFGAWLKIQTPESISLKKAEIQSNAHWYQVGSEIAGTSTSDHFGVSVACNHNGTRIMASGSRVNSSAGRVRVYEYQDGAGTASGNRHSADWVQIGQDLTGANETGARFGASVAMSGDGNIIAIGAPFEHANGLGDSGTVRVFYLSGNTWTLLSDSGSETATTGLPDVFVGPAVNDELGRAVKLSYDGKTLAFNITNEDEGGTDRGQVRVLKYANGAWTNKGSGINGTTNSQQFGLAIDMSDDGDHLIIGANNTAPNPPEVRVFKWDGSSWGLKGSILNHTTSADAFGHAVAISNDGSVIALGIRNADNTDGADADNRGIVRMYHWSGSSWTLKNTLEYPYKEATNRDDDFGTTVNLSGDGKRLIVSSPWSDNSGDSGGSPGGTAGQLWVYEYYAGNWSLRRPVPYTSAPTFDSYQSSARTNAGGIGLMGNTDSVLGAGIENDYWLNMNTSTLGGQSIAISRDGAAIIAGEWAYNSSSAGGDRGRVRVWSMPSNIKSIWGSNDNKNWTKITTAPTREEATSNVAGIAFGFSEMAKFTNIDNPNYYKYHAIVGDAFTSIRDIRMYGIRNKGSSTLNDGALNLTKNLSVPRIGAPIDLDNTPRRENLLVEYNTSTNPIKGDRVGDSSGMENDAFLIGSAQYDSVSKAFIFPDNPKNGSTAVSPPGDNDRIHLRGALDGKRIQKVHTVSTWVRCNSPGAWEQIWAIGENTSRKHVGLWVSGQDTLSIHCDNALSGSGGNYYYYVSDLYDWNHVTVVRYGETFSDMYVYVNGVKTNSHSATDKTDGGFDFNEHTNLTIGASPRGTGNMPNTDNRQYWLDGSISNFKLYDTALTADEVKTLYDMGRCDDGSHVVNFERTKVGIGLGDGGAPRGALDVRGDIYGGCPVYFQALYNANLQAQRYDVAPYGTLVPWNILFEHKGGCFDTSTGLFTAPIDGLYGFGYSVRKRGGTYADFWTYIQKNGSPLNSSNNSPGRVYVASSSSGPESVFASQNFILDLSAGDTVGVIIATVNGLDAQISNSYNAFRGYYIGGSDARRGSSSNTTGYGY